MVAYLSASSLIATVREVIWMIFFFGAFPRPRRSRPRILLVAVLAETTEGGDECFLLQISEIRKTANSSRTPSMLFDDEARFNARKFQERGERHQCGKAGWSWTNFATFPYHGIRFGADRSLLKNPLSLLPFT